MTNKKKISLVLGVMCFALTTAIVIQVRTVKNTNSTVSQNYEENNLRAEVLRYKEKYDNKYKELEEAEEELEKERKSSVENNEQLEKVENQIQQGNKIIGLTDVKGPGVIVTLKDAQVTTGTTYIGDPNDLVVHDVDVLSVVNALFNSGAEAVSVNEQRVVPTTSIICGGNIVDINGERIGAPFVIKAIGLPEYLSNIAMEGGYLDRLKDYGIVAKLEQSNSITIPKYSGVISYQYAKSVE